MMASLILHHPKGLRDLDHRQLGEVPSRGHVLMHVVHRARRRVGYLPIPRAGLTIEQGFNHDVRIVRKSLGLGAR